MNLAQHPLGGWMELPAGAHAATPAPNPARMVEVLEQPLQSPFLPIFDVLWKIPAPRDNRAYKNFRFHLNILTSVFLAEAAVV